MAYYEIIFSGFGGQGVIQDKPWLRPGCAKV